MKYLHAMLRVHDLEKTSRFLTEGLGLMQTRRMDSDAGKFTLVYFAAPANPDVEIETHPQLARFRWQPGRGLRQRAQLRPPRLRGRRHLRALRAPAVDGHHH